MRCDKPLDWSDNQTGSYLHDNALHAPASVRILADELAPATIAFAGLDKLFGYRLRRAQGAVHRDYLATLDELKLTQKQTAVMWLVMANPGVAQGAIGGVLGMDRATMMALVNRLEGRGTIAAQAFDTSMPGGVSCMRRPPVFD